MCKNCSTANRLERPAGGVCNGDKITLYSRRGGGVKRAGRNSEAVWYMLHKPNLDMWKMNSLFEYIAGKIITQLFDMKII